MESINAKYKGAVEDVKAIQSKLDEATERNKDLIYTLEIF